MSMARWRLGHQLPEFQSSTSIPNPIHLSLTGGLSLLATNPYLQLLAGSCSQITPTTLIFFKHDEDWVLFISLLVYELYVGRGQKTSRGSCFEGFSLYHAGQELLHG